MKVKINISVRQFKQIICELSHEDLPYCCKSFLHKMVRQYTNKISRKAELNEKITEILYSNVDEFSALQKNMYGDEI